MKPAIRSVLLMVLFSMSAARTSGQEPRQPYAGRDTWYEFLMKQFNPSEVDYGAWLERRRDEFRKATINEPRFWYSLSVTTALLFLTIAYAKLYVDHRRSMRVTAEMMADLYSHDLYSRQAASQAVEKYNRHIEQCNRAIEASEGREASPGRGETQADMLRAELQRATSQLETTTQDRNKLQEQLREKALIVADLSTRLDALSKKLNASRQTVRHAEQPVSADANGGDGRFVGQINRLQEELYAERQKNKRLKGA